jgi:Domain of unknown function (DUF397)
MIELQQCSLMWKKSTASGGAGCVEVARVGDTFFIRDSKEPLGSVLALSGGEWRALLIGARGGEFYNT